MACPAEGSRIVEFRVRRINLQRHQRHSHFRRAFGSLPEPGAIETLRQMTARVSPELAASKILAEQSCYRPVTEDGLPLIGPVPGIKGAYVATGHSVWGMLNAPATGEAMAALITGGASTVDLAPFDPARLPPL